MEEKGTKVDAVTSLFVPYVGSQFDMILDFSSVAVGPGPRGPRGIRVMGFPNDKKVVVVRRVDGSKESSGVDYAGSPIADKSIQRIPKSQAQGLENTNVLAQPSQTLPLVFVALHIGAKDR